MGDSVPPRIRRLSAVRATHPEFQPEWRATDDTVLTNPRFGALVHVAVTADDGRPLFDLPIWAEPVGAITLPVLPDGRLALVEVWRPTQAALADQATWPPDALEGRGRWSLEVPRGFPEPGELPAEAARREAEEETGLRITSVERIGTCSPNTTFMLNALPIFRAHASGERVRPARDPREHIRRSTTVTLDDALAAVRQGRILCGLSQTALLCHLVHPV